MLAHLQPLQAIVLVVGVQALRRKKAGKTGLNVLTVAFKH